ncbi:DUF5658 family protein [uncultured Limnobacter sp.]|uniref:DUF5658 family protein n=1 Tax=uncultured Limnobacter sp. TaxID=199681 RepID=UPI0032B1DE9C|tara:strand:- start:8004 stop:8345 length:342 start_codon:yes stop_codon:yes gene_type:complete
MSLHDWMLLGYVLFVTLNVVDLFITKVILENGGKEWNFVARFFYKHMGIKGIAWLKVFVLAWFGIQYYFKVLDLYVIFYLNFMFAVVLYFMYQDAVQAGLKDKLNPARLFTRK